MIYFTGPIYLIILVVVGGYAYAQGRHIKAVATRRESNMRKRNPRASAFKAVITVDENGGVVEFNPSAEKMFGYALKDAKGQNIANLIVPPALREEQRQGLKRYSKTSMERVSGKPLSVNGVRKDGEIFPIQMIVNPVQKGNRQLFTAFIRDVTDHKKAIEKHRKMENELAQLSRLSAMGELTTVLAHELNQPLAVISSGSQLFRDTLRSGAGDPKTMLNTAELVAEQAQRAGDLLRRIRTFISKEGSCRKSTSVNDLIDDIANLIRLDAQRGDIAVQFDLGKDLPMVFADPIHIQQVILNLVHNSVEEMSEGPSHPCRITINTEVSADEMVTVSVRDTGKGIPDDIRDQIFGPFFTTKPAGLGMGLSVSRTIIEVHEGTLWVDADDGPDTVFKFTLPVIKKKSAEVAVQNPFQWVNRSLGHLTLWGRHVAKNAFSRDWYVVPRSGT